MGKVTLNECLSQIYEELEWGIWWDDYQRQLRDKYIY